MSNQVSNIHNPLNIPDFLENIFEYLPTETLVRLTYVNRMWRLEARYKLYKDRSNIIYESLEWFLDIMRVGRYPDVVLREFTKSVIRVAKFRITFNIVLRTELLTIRNKLEAQYKVVEAQRANEINDLLKAQKKSIADPKNLEKYALYQRLNDRLRTLDYNKCNAYRELANFEYFLVKYNYIVDRDEINRINDKFRNINGYNLLYEYDTLANF